ncbi:MAG: hypothetical protein KAX73_01600 [Aquabacterium sp.]|nr:hypothetical protein [Aquabacterium sp.]
MNMRTFLRRFNWAQQLDFVGPRINTSLWGWALMVLGLCAAVYAADHAQNVQHAVDAEQATLHRLQRAQHQRQLAQAPLRSASNVDAAWQPEALVSAQGVVRMLAYPWAKTFDQVEQAALQEQALLLSLAVDQDKPLTDARSPIVVRLSAAVISDEAALQWAAAHGDGAQLLARDRMATPAPSPQGDYPWRADVSWVGGAP